MAKTREKETKVPQADEARTLGEIYKTAKSGADTVLNFMPYVKEEGMRRHLTMQLDGYERCAACAAEELEAMGESAKSANAVKRLSARAVAAMNTMVSSTQSHVASLLLQSTNANISDMTRILNATAGSEDSSRTLARDLATFEEYNRAKLLRYL